MLKVLGAASKIMCGVVKNIDNGMDDGGVEYVNAVSASGVDEHNEGARGEGGDISDDSIDDGDKWLNEFKMRREAITSSPIPKDERTEEMEKRGEGTKEKEPEKEKAAVDVIEESARRRSYALTGGKKSMPLKRQSTLKIGWGAGSSSSGLERANSKLEQQREGYLWKKGQKRHNWKRRYFAVEGHMLVYYKDETMNKRLGAVDLRGGKVDVVRHAKNDFAFDIMTPAENGVIVRHLHCDSEIERIRWLLNVEGVLSEHFGEREVGEEMEETWSEGEVEDGEDDGGEEEAQMEQEEGKADVKVEMEEEQEKEATEMKQNASGRTHRSASLVNALDALMGDDDEVDMDVNLLDDDAPSVPTLEHLASSEDFVSNDKSMDGGASMLSSVLEAGSGVGGSSDTGDDVGLVQSLQEQTMTAPASQNSSNEKSSGSGYSVPSLNVPAAGINNSLLQSNYDTLLSMLREERRVRNKLGDKIANLEHTLLETSTAYQIEIDDLKLENIEVTRKFQKLTKESAYEEVFAQFEGEIKRVRRRELELQETNVKLEMEVQGMARRRADGKVVGRRGVEQPPMQFQDGLMKQIQRRNKELEGEVKKLRSDNSTLKQQARLLNVSKNQVASNQSSMLKLGDDLKLSKMKIQGLAMKKSDLESSLMQAERESAMWRQAHASSEASLEKMKLELAQATADIIKYKQAAKSNNLIQRFLDKHAPKPAELGRGKMSGGDGGTLHDAVQDLASEVRKVCPSLMGSVARVANKVEDELNIGRRRERDLMTSMVELLDENVEQIEGGVESFRQRKIAVAQRAMMGK